SFLRAARADAKDLAHDGHQGGVDGARRRATRVRQRLPVARSLRHRRPAPELLHDRLDGPRGSHRPRRRAGPSRPAHGRPRRGRNVLMGLGALANVAALAPRNFIHCVFDNEVYGSTGNQASPSRHARLDAIAAAAGYRTVAAVDDAEAVTAAIRRMLASDGPHFLLAKVTAAEADVPRIPHTPTELRDRFRAAASR